jgi:hypothetical protein
MATPTNPSSLAELLAGFELDGYRGQMAARPDGFVLCTACHQETPAEEMQVHGLERMEGASDPDDMLAVVAVVCPVCGTQGTLVLGYGPEAAADDAEVLARLGNVA